MDGIALWNSLPWVFLYLPLAVLVVLCVLCLVKMPGDRRRGLLPVAAAMAVCAAVLFGGAWLLENLGLAWRMVPKTVLGTAVWLLGLVSGILTVRYTMRWLNERRPKLTLWGVALTLYCLISVMGVGSVVGGLWALDPTEQVGTWQGRKVVQGEWIMSYSVYEHHGPLVRGARSLAWSESPILEENGLQGMAAAEKDLGISLSGGTILSFEDTHGGFLGDGETFLTVAFAEPPKWLEDWTPLPLTENLARVNSSLAADFFPDVQQGRYFFRDRHAESADPSDDSELFSRASWNFSLAVYDTEGNILYYYKLDTRHET